MSEKKVVIVVPISNRAELTASEELSLRHLKKHLGHHDIFIVAPEGLDVEFPGLEIKRFSPQYFGSVAGPAVRATTAVVVAARKWIRRSP